MTETSRCWAASPAESARRLLQFTQVFSTRLPLRGPPCSTQPVQPLLGSDSAEVRSSLQLPHPITPRPIFYFPAPHFFFFFFSTRHFQPKINSPVTWKAREQLKQRSKCSSSIHPFYFSTVCAACADFQVLVAVENGGGSYKAKQAPFSPLRHHKPMYFWVDKKKVWSFFQTECESNIRLFPL